MNYICVLKTSKMDTVNKAEEQLREIANKSNTSIKNIYALVTQAFIDDTNYQKRVNEMRNAEVQYDQLKLLKMQTANELIQNQLLSFTLSRKLKIRKFFGLIKTPKPHESK